MSRIKLMIEMDEDSWLAYVAAIKGDDGVVDGMSEEEFNSRQEFAKEILLADIARKAVAHTIDRQAKKSREQIEAVVKIEENAKEAPSVVLVTE